MRPFAYPIIVLTICLAIGIGIQNEFSVALNLLIIAFSALLAVSFFAYYRAKKLVSFDAFFGLFISFLFIVLGSVLLYFNTSKNLESHYSKVSFKEENIFKGTISSELKANAKYHKYIISVQEFNKNVAFGFILIYVPKELQIYKIGDELLLNGKLQLVPKAFNPNQFDYAAYLAKQNVYHQSYNPTIVYIQHHKSVKSWASSTRNSLVNSFKAHQFDKDTQSIINALLFGQRNTIDTELLQKYSKTGVVHILAISGLHIGILYFFLAFLTAPLKRYRWGKIFQLLFVLVFLWSFAFIIGMPVSVTRAVVLFSLVSIAKYFNLQRHLFNTVALSALILLVYNPNYLFDIGFQLSYAAVIAILLFQPFFKRFYFTKNKLGVYFSDIILVSIAAQIGVLPLSLYYFHQMPLLFIVANILVIPIASFLLIAGIFVVILNFVYLPAAILIGKLLKIAVKIMNEYIDWLSNIKVATIQNISFSYTMVLLSYIFVLTLIYFFYHKKFTAFRNLVVAFLVCQLFYAYEVYQNKSDNELLVFNSRKPIIGVKSADNFVVFTNDSLANVDIINTYMMSHKINQATLSGFKNVYSFNESKVLVIDSSSVYNENLKADYVILSQSPKVNLERLILVTQPKVIIADNSNPLYKLDLWKTICVKKKIPFHAIAEKGLYSVKE